MAHSAFISGQWVSGGGAAMSSSGLTVRMSHTASAALATDSWPMLRQQLSITRRLAARASRSRPEAAMVDHEWKVRVPSSPRKLDSSRTYGRSRLNLWQQASLGFLTPP